MGSLLSLVLVLAAAGRAGGDGYRAPASQSSGAMAAVIYALLVLAAMCVLGFKSAPRTRLK